MKERVNNFVAVRRKQAGQTQEELAGAVDVTRQTIISIEKGTTFHQSVGHQDRNHFKQPVEEVFQYEQQ